MTIKAAIPYLLLGDNTERAIALYQSALGAHVEALQRFGDVDKSCPEAMRDSIMHAELRAGTAVWMMSGGPGPIASTSGSISVALSLDDSAETRRAFDALAVNGTVVQPLIDSPWGSLFGIVSDQFGINWMFDCATK